MPLTNAGRDFIAGAVIGVGTFFDAAHAYIGVGDSTTAFDATQTDLQAVSANRTRKPMDATYPQRTGNSIQFSATYGANDANYAWNEWGIFNDPTAGDMLNRQVEYNGTKLQGQTWTFDTTITITVA